MTDRERRNCPDCDAEPGAFHVLGCDVEQCPYCGGQLISCDCRAQEHGPPLDDRIPWSGEWPGVAECREFGLYCKRAEGKGWRPCSADDPEASEDLNRLAKEYRWDRGAKRWVKK
jgi:hypothetical protein